MLNLSGIFSHSAIFYHVKIFNLSKMLYNVIVIAIVIVIVISNVIEIFISKVSFDAIESIIGNVIFNVPPCANINLLHTPLQTLLFMLLLIL